MTKSKKFMPPNENESTLELNSLKIKDSHKKVRKEEPAATPTPSELVDDEKINDGPQVAVA